MQARPFTLRSQRPVRYQSNGDGYDRYYAYCDGVLPNYSLVTDGVLMKGDYFKENKYSKAWIQALGAVGSPVENQFAVCRPNKK